MTSEHRFGVMAIAIRYLEQKRLIQEADINYNRSKIIEAIQLAKQIKEECNKVRNEIISEKSENKFRDILKNIMEMKDFEEQVENRLKRVLLNS